MNPVTLGISVIYDSDMFGLQRLGIVGNGSAFDGWLMIENPSGEWMSLADLRPHFKPPEPSDHAKVCAQYAARIADLERENAALRTAK